MWVLTPIASDRSVKLNDRSRLRYAPRRIITDKLRSYGAARKEVLPEVIHDSAKW